MIDTIKRKFSYGYVCDYDYAALSCSGNMKTSATCNHNNSKDLLCSGQLKKILPVLSRRHFQDGVLKRRFAKHFPSK